MKSFVKICLVLVTAVTMAADTAHAQTSAATTSTNAPAAKPRPKSKPYSGTIASADSDAKTITVTLANGESQTIKITSKTRIKKGPDGEPATLADATAGQKIRGYEHKDDAGDWVATTVNIGERKPKTAAPAAAAPATKQ
jgi:hypothetical protein